MVCKPAKSSSAMNELVFQIDTNIMTNMAKGIAPSQLMRSTISLVSESIELKRPNSVLNIQRHIRALSAVGNAQGKSTAIRTSPLPRKLRSRTSANPMPITNSMGTVTAVKKMVLFSEVMKRGVFSRRW